MYSVEEIKKIINPLAQQFGVERMYLFGSYARCEATEKSDIDFRIDKGAISGLFEFTGFLIKLEEALQKPVDLLSTGSLDKIFLKTIANEEITIYDPTQRS
jgi:predicted nucleotidyltransferase